ncbi:hypothetical protein KA531_00935 [Candidatus Saccharibacteria bacterium]|nr:hypothetical protein [Candidatus Saccharibacteria bacterium]
MKSKFLDKFNQIALPGFTLGGQLAIALKYPSFGYILALLSQPFWLYSSWKSYREANQIGILIASVGMSIIVGIGFINYWFL